MPTHATRVPTLLIGVGGIGGQIAKMVKENLNDFDRSKVAIVALDTDINDISKIRDDIPYIQTSENRTVSNYLKRHRQFTVWFPQNPHINKKILTDGAGQIRSVSRLGALASEEAGRFESLRSAIRQVLNNDGDGLITSVRVMIVGSICGGTGSGMGIQLPFLVRDLIKEETANANVIIRGLFLTPQLVEAKQKTEETKRSVNVNAYAFLRELNAFYRTQEEFNKSILKVEHYHDDMRSDIREAKPVPYDFMFMIEESSSQGRNIGGFDQYLRKAADIVTAQLFTPMSRGNFSAEDNQIISTVETQGMNRYCGAGVSKAYYPSDEIKRYCLLRYSSDLINGYWTFLDRKFKAKDRQQEIRMASSSDVRPLERGQQYVEMFNAQTDALQNDVPAAFSVITPELRTQVEITSEEGEKKRYEAFIPDYLFKEILSYIDSSLMTDRLNESVDSCSVTMSELRIKQEAMTTVEAMMDSLKALKRDLDERVNSMISECTDGILTASTELLAFEETDRKKYDIYHAIHKMHPITARYMLYYLRDKFAEHLKVNEQIRKNALNEEAESGIFKKDYYIENDSKGGSKSESIENPYQALDLVSDKYVGLFTTKKYKKLISEIYDDSHAETERMITFAKAKLHINIAQELIKRLNILIHLYENFFDDLDILLEENKEQCTLLERDTLNDKPFRDFNGDTKICADKLCKQSLYRQFSNGIGTMERVALPEQAKMSFFETMFEEYTKEYEKAADSDRDSGRRLSSRELFEGGILEPLVQQLDVRRFACIDLDIIQAIDKELAVYKKQENDEGKPGRYSSLTLAEYIKDICANLRTKSAPYLAASQGAGRVSCYWGINHSVAMRYQNRTDNVDNELLMQMLGDGGDTIYEAIADDSYDPRHLICYSSFYGLFIDDLPKYSKDGRPYECYRNRIARVIRKDFDLGTNNNVDAYLDVVHPHLDRRWHTHHYLPELYITDDEAYNAKLMEAFFYALATSRFVYMTVDEKNCWTYRETGTKAFEPVLLEDNIITRTSYNELFDALDENGIIVDDLINVGQRMRQNASDSANMDGIDLDTLMQHKLIRGLIGEKLTDDEKDSLNDSFLAIMKSRDKTFNVLDIIYSIYRNTGDFALAEKLVGALESFLYDYCMEMTNHTPGRSSVLSEQLMQAIMDNSSMEYDARFNTLFEKEDEEEF